MAKIFVCGDLINAFVDTNFISNQIVKIISETDYAICNFEGTLPFPDCVSTDMIQRPSTLDTLKADGFNMLLLANNHVTDYGKIGLETTISKIKQYEFDYMGAGLSYEEAYQPFIKEIAGIKFGFVNVCEAQIGHYERPDQSFGYAWIGDENVLNRISKLKKIVDHVIVFVHAGLEKYVLPLKEYRALYKQYCDAGASCVIGGHPHVAQGIEIYNNKLIAYSLGNFYFPSTFCYSELWNNSFSVVLNFNTNSYSYDVIYHETKNNVVDISSNKIVDVTSLSKQLHSPQYDELLAKQNSIAFHKLVYPLYKEALQGFDYKDSFPQKALLVFNYIFNKAKYKTNEKYRLQLLRRLVQNETYQYLTIDAITHLLSE